jgi:hypothetical protein
MIKARLKERFVYFRTKWRGIEATAEYTFGVSLKNLHQAARHYCNTESTNKFKTEPICKVTQMTANKCNVLSDCGLEVQIDRHLRRATPLNSAIETPQRAAS